MSAFQSYLGTFNFWRRYLWASQKDRALRSGSQGHNFLCMSRLLCLSPWSLERVRDEVPSPLIATDLLLCTSSSLAEFKSTDLLGLSQIAVPRQHFPVPVLYVLARDQNLCISFPHEPPCGPSSYSKKCYFYKKRYHSWCPFQKTVMENNEDGSTVGLDPSLLNHQTLQWPLWNELTCFVVVPRDRQPRHKKNQNRAPGQSRQTWKGMTWMREQNCFFDYSWYCQDSQIYSVKFTSGFSWHCSHNRKKSGKSLS